MLRGDLFFRWRRRDDALVGNFGELFNRIFDGHLHISRLFGTAGCVSRFRSNAGTPLLLTARALVRARRFFFACRLFFARRFFFDGLAEIDFVFLFHELGEVRDVKEGIALKADVDEGRLHAGQHFHHPAFVEVADDALILVTAFDIKFRHHAVFKDGDLFFMHIRANDQFFCHGFSW